jgi:hypothetical protein
MRHHLPSKQDEALIESRQGGKSGKRMKVLTRRVPYKKMIMRARSGEIL